ncbi:MAG: hypothetical protein WC760_05795 [Bacteroidia bacterium]|jgi:hypothetical protein
MKYKMKSLKDSVKGYINSVNFFRWGVFVALFTITGGCYSVKSITPTENDVARVKDKYPGYSLTDLNRGKDLFVNYCGNCHKHKNPASKTEEEWTVIVPKMSAKANKKSLVLDENAQQDILRFVITMRDASR